MKTVEIKEWKKKQQQLANKMSQHDCKHEDYNNPQEPRYNWRGQRGNAIPNKPATKCTANYIVKLQPICTRNGKTADHF